MKNNIRKLIALAMVLTLLLSMSAFAAKETASEGIRLPAVLERDPAGEETPAETETPAEIPTTVIGSAYVSLEQADSTLNVRAAATTDSDRLGSLANGDKVSVLGYDGEWTIISFGGGAGYVKSSYLSSSAPEAPETEAPAEPEATEEPVEPEAPAETEEPAEPEAPAESEEPAEPEVPAETEEPVATEAPAESAEPEVTAEPAATEEAEEAEAEEAIPVTVVGEADVRLEGDGLSEIFVTLPEGTELTVLGIEGDWVMVEIDGQIGYIYKDSVLGIEFEEPELPEDEKPIPQVTIFSSRRSAMEMGETVYLTSKLENTEGYEIRLQWQWDRGNGFENIEGATEDSYSFAASVETLAYDWQLLVYYRDAV